jgi:hypothetical protein
LLTFDVAAAGADQEIGSSGPAARQEAYDNDRAVAGAKKPDDRNAETIGSSNYGVVWNVVPLAIDADSICTVANIPFHGFRTEAVCLRAVIDSQTVGQSFDPGLEIRIDLGVTPIVACARRPG